MRFCFQSKPIAILITCLALALTAGADTLVLNSGVTHEGKLISKSDDSVMFEIGTSVKQVRTFKRSEIKSLTVIPADEIAYQSLRELLPTDDLLDASDYRRMIEGAPKNFLSAFPTSQFKPEVEKIVTTLEDERSRVLAGGVKLNGDWITKEQIAADPYNHHGRVTLAQIQSHIAKAELLDSLRAFDTLEKDYAESSSYPEAVAAIKEILPQHSTRLATRLATSTRDNKRRETDYGRMREDERAKAEAAYNRQLNPFLEKHAADKAAKKKWLDFHIWDLESISYAQEEAKKESARLDQLDVAALTTRSQAIEEAAALAAAGKFLEASDLIKTIGKTEPGSRADELKSSIAAGVELAEEEAAREEAAAERAERMKEREAAAAAEIAKAKEENISQPIPAPAALRDRGDGSGGENGDSEILKIDDEGVKFDRTGGEFKGETGGGFSILTVLIILIPVMGIVTFISIRTAKNNQVDDFVPIETDEDTEEKEEE